MNLYFLKEFFGICICMMNVILFSFLVGFYFQEEVLKFKDEFKQLYYSVENFKKLSMYNKCVYVYLYKKYFLYMYLKRKKKICECIVFFFLNLVDLLNK